MATSAETGSASMSERILRSAERMFRTYGYGKTTVADVARDVGISTAYVYRFYPAKIAIAEAVCGTMLTRLTDLLWQEAKSTHTPDDKFRRLFVRLTEECLRLQFEEERLLEVIQAGMDEEWAAVERYHACLGEVSGHILAEGLTEGRFRISDPVEQVADTIGALLLLCSHPAMLNEARKKNPVGRARALASLMLDGIKQ